MAEKICLDTDIIIAVLKEDRLIIEFLDKITNEDIFITSITVFELFLRHTNLDVIENFIENVQILSLDDNSAKKASELYKLLSKKGEILDLRDLFIASICLNNNLKLLTLNRKHFERVPRLELETFN